MAEKKWRCIIMEMNKEHGFSRTECTTQQSSEYNVELNPHVNV
jgi:hypothetical protein